MSDLKLDLCIIGGGMITNDLILPSAYQLQRNGVVGDISICARHNAPLRKLKVNKEIAEAFPGHDFQPFPSFDHPPEMMFQNMYREAVDALNPRQAVIIAVPDQFHFEIVMYALERNQHVLCVKPLVLKYEHALEIEKLAAAKRLFVGIEYHKRFDRRALLAKRQYQRGDFGEFTMGEAKLIEPYFYRHSNFQNWFTCDQTDPFVYVGCHYVDQVTFITGLKPVELSVSGCKGKFPNGKEGYMWTNGRVKYENGAILSVLDGLGYPDAGAGSNDQCLGMYCEGEGRSALIQHDDQYRGVRHCYLEPVGCAGSVYNYVSPDFYRLVPWDGPGAMPVGYGYESVAANIEAMWKLETAVSDMPLDPAMETRKKMLKELDERGIIATPANSNYNELVIEAARLSIEHDGDWACIEYGDTPSVKLRERK